MEYLKLHIMQDQLSEKIGKEIPLNSLMLVEGNDGSGKSIIAQRLTYGFLQNGSKVTYISSEMSTLEFVNQMQSLNYNIHQDLINENLLFIPMFPTLGHVEFKTEFLEGVKKAEKLYQNDVIIFDSLSYMIVNESLDRHKVFQFIDFLKRLTSLNKFVLLTIDPNMINKEFLNILKNIADIYFLVDLKQVLGQTLRIVNIQRFKRAKINPSTEFAFSVKPEVGLVIEIASLS